MAPCRIILSFARVCRVGVWFGFVMSALLLAVDTFAVLSFEAMPGPCSFLHVTFPKSQLEQHLSTGTGKHAFHHSRKGAFSGVLAGATEERVNGNHHTDEKHIPPQDEQARKVSKWDPGTQMHIHHTATMKQAQPLHLPPPPRPSPNRDRPPPLPSQCCLVTALFVGPFVWAVLCVICDDARPLLRSLSDTWSLPMPTNPCISTTSTPIPASRPGKMTGPLRLPIPVHCMRFARGPCQSPED